MTSVLVGMCSGPFALVSVCVWMCRVAFVSYVRARLCLGCICNGLHQVHSGLIVSLHLWVEGHICIKLHHEVFE